jgi:hypothetical protein
MTVRFEKMAIPNRVLLLAGLVLTPASFWFPRDSPLHGGSGASLGLGMLLVAVWGVCRWFEVLFATVAAAACISGGFWYRYDRREGLVLSIIGMGLLILAALSYIQGRLHLAKRA